MGNQTPNTKQLKKKNLHVLRTFQSCTHAKTGLPTALKLYVSYTNTGGFKKPKNGQILRLSARRRHPREKKNTSSSQRRPRTHTRQKKKLHSVFQHSPSVPKFCRKNLPLQEERIESSQRQREVKVGQYLGQRGAKCEKPPLRSSLEPSFCTNYTAGLCDTRN